MVRTMLADMELGDDARARAANNAVTETRYAHGS